MKPGNSRRINRKYIDNLSERGKESVSRIARDSLAVETLGELAVYSAALPYQSFVAVTLSKIMSLTGASTGSVFRYDAAAESSTIVLWQGLETEDVESFAKQPVEDDVPGLAAACILKRTPILVGDPLNDSRLATPYFRKTIGKYNLTSAIALPLVKEARVYGAMVLFTAGAEKFNDDDVSFLRAVSMPVAASFEAQARVAEINRERERLWNIFESLSMGVIFLDNNGVIANCNKTALKMLAMEEGMLTGNNAREVLFPHLLNAKNEQAYTEIGDISRDRTEELTYIAPFVRRKTAEAPSRWNARFTDIDGGCVLVFSDNCRQKDFFTSQSALAEAAVKYVRQPVRSMMEAMSMVALSGDLNSRQYENLERAQNLAEKMWHNLRLAEKSVEYSTGHVKPSREAIRVDDILVKARARFDDALKDKGMSVDFAAGDGVVYGDAMMLAETIDVVISEAVEASQAGSRLFLTAGPSGGGIRIKISSDRPPRAGMSNPLAIQYLRSFFAFIKGDIDFNPPAEEGGLIPVVAFFIPA